MRLLGTNSAVGGGLASSIFTVAAKPSATVGTARTT